MRTLLDAVGLAAIAWMSHFILWRIRLPKNQTRTLLQIFALFLGLWLLVAAPGRFIASEVLQVILLYGAMALCYVITYSAIEGDSPTLSMMRLLAEKEGQGLSKEETARFFLDRPFVKARLEALVRTGHIREENDRYVVAGKPSVPFRIILAFRKLYGPLSKGG